MKSIRNHDEQRIMLAFDKAGRAYPTPGPGRTLATISDLADLIDDIRHETLEHASKRIAETMTLVTNAAMTPERLRRLLASPRQSAEPEKGNGT